MPQNTLKSKSSLRKIFVTLQLPTVQPRSQEYLWHSHPTAWGVSANQGSSFPRGNGEWQNLFQTWEEMQRPLILQVRFFLVVFFFHWCFSALLCKNEILVDFVIHIPTAEQTCWGFCWERNLPICIPRAIAIATGSRRRRKQGWISNSGFKTGKRERSVGGETSVV